MDTNKLIELLKQGIVEIQYKSLNSGKTYNREYTLHESMLPLKLKQSNVSDKILCYDVEFQKMEDIDVHTIEHYKPLQKLS